MQSKDYGQYFIPKAAHSADDLAGSPAVHNGMLCIKKCVVTRILFVLTTAVAASTALPVVEFNHRPTPGSATNETALGTLTFPDLSAIGKVLYKDVTPKVFLPGEELSFEHTVAATDASSAAGAGYYAVEFDDSPEYVGNVTDMIASA